MLKFEEVLRNDYYEGSKEKFIDTLESDMDYFGTENRFKQEQLLEMTDAELMMLYYYIWGISEALDRK